MRALVCNWGGYGKRERAKTISRKEERTVQALLHLGITLRRGDERVSHLVNMITFP